MNQLPGIAFEAAPADTRATREPLSSGNNIELIAGQEEREKVEKKEEERGRFPGPRALSLGRCLCARACPHVECFYG